MGPPARSAPRQRWSCRRHRAPTTGDSSVGLEAVPVLRAPRRRRCTASAGSRPRTASRPPTGSAPSARSISRWPPRSSPRSSRSIVAGGDLPSRVVEAERVDGRLERRVALECDRRTRPSALRDRAAGAPRIGVRHAQQQLLNRSTRSGRRRGPAVMLQWSNGAVWARTRVDRPAACPHGRTAGGCRRSCTPRRPRRRAARARPSRSPPMWSPCSPTPTSNRRTVKSTGVQARPAAGGRAAAASPAASRPRRRPTLLPRRSASDRIGESPRTTITDVRSRSVSRIADARTDRRRARPAGARAPRPAASSRRRAMRPVEQIVDLAFVVRVQHVVEGEALRAGTTRGTRPDRDDLRVVGDRAEQQAVTARRRRRAAAGQASRGR